MINGSISGCDIPQQSLATEEAELATTQPLLDEPPPDFSAARRPARPPDLVMEGVDRHGHKSRLVIHHLGRVQVGGVTIVNQSYRGGRSTRCDFSDSNARDPFAIFKTDPFTGKRPAGAAKPARQPHIRASGELPAVLSPPGSTPLDPAAEVSVRGESAPVPDKPATVPRTPFSTRGQDELDRFVSRMCGMKVSGVQGAVTTTIVSSQWTSPSSRRGTSETSGPDVLPSRGREASASGGMAQRLPDASRLNVEGLTGSTPNPAAGTDPVHDAECIGLIRGEHVNADRATGTRPKAARRLLDRVSNGLRRIFSRGRDRGGEGHPIDGGRLQRR
ncbi:hypothetical protein CDL60_15310 [Roseateles noduli]|nr:hypothetical protein CDL60_15310 [Roseateles noduli]